MEIKVGAKFNKVGTDEIVTVTKYDSERGTVIVKFSSGRSIPMSTGSLMKADKWAYIEDVKCEDEQEEVAVEEKPKKAKKEKVKKEKSKKPMVKKSKAKIQDTMDEILEDALIKCTIWVEFTFYNKSRNEEKMFTWTLATEEKLHIKINYYIKEKKFEIFFDDEIADLIKDTEFGKLDEITDEFIEDKLKTLLDTIVEKLNEKTESEEKTDGTI